jgi:ribonucleoside-diphosphate reductase alpha chain
MKKLPSDFQSYIHLSRYSRWLWDKNRRETWEETVKRYFDFFQIFLKENHNFDLNKDLRTELEDAVLNLEIMPSMRCLMTAGEALSKNLIAGYNCSFRAVDTTRAFDEILYALMCGVGVGFSVERQYVNQLPVIADEFYQSETTIEVPDSKIGWAKSFKELIGLLYQGIIPKIDYSKIRKAGEPLKTFGGRASGPEPLKELFDFTIKTFKNASGRKLQSIECHDIICTTAQIVVCGGRRRSALISLSNLTDERMRTAKSGQWWIENPQRALANNSACYTEKPDISIFMDEWKSLYQSRSGERGIFNLMGARKQADLIGRRDSSKISGLNPCGEVLLRGGNSGDGGLCNLSEVIIRPNDTERSLKRKIILATILGTFQSCLTDFKYLNPKWKYNAEEERLLGVSLTGIFDNPLTNKPTFNLEVMLNKLRNVVIETNKQYAKKLKINQSAACTVIKPSGTVSSLVNSSSGIHPRHSQYYIRSVRADTKDPLCKYMIDAGFIYEDCVMNPSNVKVFYFAQKSPNLKGFRNDISAIEHLNLIQIYKKCWAEHNVSATVSIKEHEWLDVAAYVYKNFDEIVGVSFLPYTDHVYKQAPYKECTEKEYLELLKKTPQNIDWSKLSDYETTDSTEGSQEFACTGGKCEI